MFTIFVPLNHTVYNYTAIANMLLCMSGDNHPSTKLNMNILILW